jgi:hypothetical protein
MTDRVDLYFAVHKGLRYAMQATLLRLGQLDSEDLGEVSESLGQLRDLLVWMEEHLSIEDKFVHAAIETRRPGALLARLRDEHEGHGRAFSLLRADADGLERSLGESSGTRAAWAARLYIAFSRFVGDNLVHMALEETDLNALLWELFTDQELGGIFHAILASESPEQLGRSVRWVLPALSPAERARVLGGARASIEPQVFQHLVGQLRQFLSPRDGEKLEAALRAA